MRSFDLNASHPDIMHFCVNFVFWIWYLSYLNYPNIFRNGAKFNNQFQKMSQPTVRKTHETTWLKIPLSGCSRVLHHVTWSSSGTKLLLKNLNQTWTSSPWRNLNVYSSRTNGNPVKTMIRDGGKPILAALESNSQLIQKLNWDVERIQFVSTIKSQQVIFSDWDF